MTIKQLFAAVEKANEINTIAGNTKIVVVLNDFNEETIFYTWKEYKKYIIDEYIPPVATQLLKAESEEKYRITHIVEETFYTAYNIYRIYLDRR